MHKLSQYCIFLKSKNEDRYWIYQTLYRRIIEIKHSSYKNFKQGKFIFLSSVLKEKLKILGILINYNKQKEQNNLYSYYYNKVKYFYTTPGIVIVPGFSCNLRCIYCYQGLYPKFTDSMDDGIVKKLIYWINRHDKIKLGFYGGEPCIFDKKIIQILSGIKIPKIVSISLITNGFVFPSDFLQELKKFNNVLIQITFAGDENIHNKLRPTISGQGSFEQVYKNLLKLIKIPNINLLVRIDVCDQNYSSIPHLLKKLSKLKKGIKLGFEKILPPHIIPCDYRLNESKEQKISKLYSIASKMGFKFPIGEKGDLPLFSFCASQTLNAFAVNPKGEIFKCMGFADLSEMNCGNLEKNGKITWNNNYFDWMSRVPFNINDCKKCPILPLCNGGCAMEAFHKHGTIHAKGCTTWTNYGSNVIIPYLTTKYKLPPDLKIVKIN
ncbi:MAG: SPASM domain-containing protein [Nanoarchaeota archaeon]